MLYLREKYPAMMKAGPEKKFLPENYRV